MMRGGIFTGLLLAGWVARGAESSPALPPQSVEALGKVLGYSDADKAFAESKVFGERVRAGFLPKDWNTTCGRDFSDILCSSLKEYFSLAEMSEGTRRRRSRLPRFDVKKIRDLERADFQDMLNAAPDWSKKQIKAFSEAARKVSECPRNFSLVLARKAEVHFPESEYIKLSQELGNRGLECVDAKHPSAEFLFMRQGLLAYSQKHLERAVVLLESSLNAQVKKERYRTLFWLSRIYGELNNSEKAKFYKEQLTSLFPVSWMSIQIRLRHGEDPVKALQSNAVYADAYSSGDNSTDRRWAWLKLFLLHDNMEYAVKRYTEFLMKRMPQGVLSAFLQHQARILESKRFFRLQILILSWISSNKPNDVTYETLKLMYPAPFYDEIDMHTPHLDTAVLLGLVRQESGFDVSAHSSANAMGLFQVLPRTARTVKRGTTKKDLFDFQKNIPIGSKYFFRLVSLNKGSVEQSLAGYNAGQTHVNRWVQRYAFARDDQLFVDLIPFRETRDYIPSILRNAYWYHRLIPNLSTELTAKRSRDEIWYTSDLLKSLVLKSLSLERNPANRK